MTADTIAIGFEEGALDSIGMSGSGVVNHASVGQAARSRVSGDRVVVLLHASEIHRVRATGHAACAHAISGKESEAATLTGDSVWAEFERGKLQHTRADGGVRGRYGSEGASSK